MDKLELVKGGFRRGDKLGMLGLAYGKGKLSRVDIALNVEQQMARKGILNPVLIITENKSVANAWVEALPDRQIIAVVVDFDAAEVMLERARVDQWVIVFDDLGEGPEYLDKYAPRMKALMNREPRLILSVTQAPPHNTDLSATLGYLSASSLNMPSSMRWNRQIKSSQVKLHKVNDLTLIAVLTDALGQTEEWPEYAIYGDHIYKRGMNAALDESMGAFHSIFGAREYNVMSPHEQADVRDNGIQALAKALIFIP